MANKNSVDDLEEFKNTGVLEVESLIIGGEVVDPSPEVGGGGLEDLDVIITSHSAKTAGTTQTQAGATLITDTITTITSANAGDGLRLPPMVAGRFLILDSKFDAVGCEIYAHGTETLNGVAGNAGSCSLGSSTVSLVLGVGAGVSIMLFGLW